MVKLSHLSNKHILVMIGERVEAARLNEGIDQKLLAEKSGVSVGTVQNIENGKASVGLIKVIAILRALNMLEQINNFIPPPPPQSIALTTTKNKVRQRVASVNAVTKNSKEFTWGKKIPMKIGVNGVLIKDEK
jgi:transcriptional regulator with XRE-family HTH domain